jgi:hypothetical protein
MQIRVQFSERDMVLAAIIRALAFKVAGRSTTMGRTEEFLFQQGFYDYDFSPSQLEKFKLFVERYLAERWRKTLQIIESEEKV